MGTLIDFLRESLAIEGIHRDPTAEECAATNEFLGASSALAANVCRLQAVYTPGKLLRMQSGMNVRVGRYVAPAGGPGIGERLEQICSGPWLMAHTPWRIHVEFEKLHPFMDGNGRTGRALWALHMLRTGQDPFAIGFLHRFYYQTLGEMP